jgi:hypothetical protein
MSAKYDISGGDSSRWRTVNDPIEIDSIACCYFTLATVSQIAAAQGLEKIRIVYASRGLPFFSAFVAKEMSFTKSMAWMWN